MLPRTAVACAVNLGMLAAQCIADTLKATLGETSSSCADTDDSCAHVSGPLARSQSGEGADTIIVCYG